jgi:hypothetical protein
MSFLGEVLVWTLANCSLFFLVPSPSYTVKRLPFMIGDFYRPDCEGIRDRASTFVTAILVSSGLEYFIAKVDAII